MICSLVHTWGSFTFEERSGSVDLRIKDGCKKHTVYFHIDILWDGSIMGAFSSLGYWHLCHYPGFRVGRFFKQPNLCCCHVLKLIHSNSFTCFLCRLLISFIWKWWRVEGYCYASLLLVTTCTQALFALSVLSPNVHGQIPTINSGSAIYWRLLQFQCSQKSSSISASFFVNVFIWWERDFNGCYLDFIESTVGEIVKNLMSVDAQLGFMDLTGT
jgi:hypothetical protein